MVIETRDNTVSMTGNLFQWARAATIDLTSRLETLSLKLRARVLSRRRVLGFQFARRPAGSLQAIHSWVPGLILLVFIAAMPIAFMTLADGDMDSLSRWAREIIPDGSQAIVGTAYSYGRQAKSPTGSNATGRITSDDLRIPGADFTGAYIAEVEHLSPNSSMVQIFVPAGVQGTYQAVVTASQDVEYQCVILHHYTDQLHCFGPSLPEASQINFRILRIDESNGAHVLVFEVNYTTGEIKPLDTPTPESTPTPTKTLTPTQAPTRFLVPTIDDADPGEDQPPPASPSPPASPPPPLSTTPAPSPSTPPLPSATFPPPSNTPLPPAATDAPERTTNPHSCKSAPSHPRYCTPTPVS